MPSFGLTRPSAEKPYKPTHSDLQNCETLIYIVLSIYVCDNLLEQPQKTSTNAVGNQISDANGGEENNQPLEVVLENTRKKEKNKRRGYRRGRQN